MNRYGLHRTIPDSVKRAVRRRDGFGCVICGKAIYDYEHFDPEYVDAKIHDPNGIVLLCIEHHGLKTRKILSKDTIRKHAAKPKCKEIGFSFGPFDIGTMHPEIVLGQLTCINTRCLISLDGDEILTVLPPFELGLPFRINADLKDSAGESILKIVDNEWRTDSANWDVEISGPSIIIRSAPRQLILVLRSEPPRRIIIERLEMNHKGTQISCDEGNPFVVSTACGSGFSAISTSISGFDTAIQVVNGTITIGVIKSKYPINFGFIGGEGSERISRNSICSCGSGIRYKHCHGKYNNVNK